MVFSERLACAECGISFPRSRRACSRSTTRTAPARSAAASARGGRSIPSGWCPIPARSLQARRAGAVGGRESTYFRQTLAALAERYKFSLDEPWSKLQQERAGRDPLRRQGRRLRGRGEGAGPPLSRDAVGGRAREVEIFMAERPCPACGGSRLRAGVARAQDRRPLHRRRRALHASRTPPGSSASLTLSEREAAIARRVLKEIRERLGFLMNVGLDYLTLDRAGRHAVGRRGPAHPPGDPDRLEPGRRALHPRRAVDRPAPARQSAGCSTRCERLRDLGNTVLVVEHDEETIRAADYVLDLGPGAGELGGHLVAYGTPEEIVANARSLTGAVPSPARAGSRCRSTGGRATRQFITIHDPREHNLQGTGVRIPLGTVHLRHRRVGLGQVHAGQRHPLPRAGPDAPPRAGAAGRARPDRGRPAHRQGRGHRPVADRPHAALEPGHLHRRVHVHPRAVRAHARGAHARLPARAASRSTSRAAAARRARATAW